MASAYTPGLLITRNHTIRKTRDLPLPGQAVVQVGDKVNYDTKVLEADLPGDLAILRLAERMGIDAIDVVSGLKVSEGDKVHKGDLLCEVKYFFGLARSEYRSQFDGTVEFFTENNGHLGIRHKSVPISIPAYISGEVVEVEPTKSVTIETKAAVIQGIFGVGGERNGIIVPIDVACDKIVDASIISNAQIPKNAVLVGGSTFSIEALEEAAKHNVAGIITGSIDSETLAKFVGYEIGVSITGDEQVPFTLIVTEGFGLLPISSRIIEIMHELQGKEASINGATQVRAGAMRPEVIVPSANGVSESTRENNELSMQLSIGTRIRIIRVPYFGAFATVIELPEAPTKIESGAVVRVLKATLDNGSEVIVPRANVELI
jgi:predicted ThiF/HesA family dinucleotide-utilizing enzyme